MRQQHVAEHKLFVDYMQGGFLSDQCCRDRED
jgi:hypothetical protein